LDPAFSCTSGKNYDERRVSFTRINLMEFSADQFRMLEGYKPGQNLTWKLALQNITQF
jgi:hypothetical protein